MITNIRKPISSTMLAIAAIVMLSVFTAGVARADSGSIEAEFDAEAAVLSVGIARDVVTEAPLLGDDFKLLTRSSSEFEFDDGVIESVEITTENEQVIGFLGGFDPFPVPFSGLGSCSDEAGGAACGVLGGLLTLTTAVSLHTSVATLDVASVDFISIPVPLHPFGGFDLLSGLIDGDRRRRPVERDGIVALARPRPARRSPPGGRVQRGV